MAEARKLQRDPMLANILNNSHGPWQMARVLVDQPWLVKRLRQPFQLATGVRSHVPRSRY
eukprot:7080599-Lingulodinium_polyedra.AAC.1